MRRKIEKRVYKETQKIPLYAQIAASEALSAIENATDFSHLCELADIVPMEGTNEPYYRLRFNQYRYILFYDAESETLEVLSLTHRKDTYKKHNLPWRR